MTDGGIATGEQLYQGILNGQVPRQVRLFAAQGLLPVSREDLLRLQVILSADPDSELAGAASQALQQEDIQVLVTWIESQEIEPVVLDLLVRVRDDEELWSAIAAHSRVSNETLRVLARNGSALIQDIIMTNQVRILGCLEILEDIRANPHNNQVILRRVHEFETEFIEKAIADDAAVLGEQEGLSIEEALEALRSIGAHIPREDVLPFLSFEDPGLKSEAERLGLSTYGRLLKMSVKDKIVAALKGTRDERYILINSRSRLVVRAVLGSPRLTEAEIERFASLRSVSDEAIRIISANRKWVQKYGVVLALTQNPKTPVQTAIRLLPRLSHRDLARVSRDRNINPVVRRRAQDFTERRR
jgi:hypothetical protein